MIRLRQGLRRDKIGFVFLIPWERDIGVSLWGKGGCGVFLVFGIGFVLRGRGFVVW